MILHERDHDRFEHRGEMQAILERLRPECDKDG